MFPTRYNSVVLPLNRQLSPTLFKVYINKLARALEESAAPGLTILESEVKCLLFADDLVLLSPTKQGLSKLVLGLCSQTQTHPTEPQDSTTIRPNQNKNKIT